MNGSWTSAGPGLDVLREGLSMTGRRPLHRARSGAPASWHAVGLTLGLLLVGSLLLAPTPAVPAPNARTPGQAGRAPAVAAATPARVSPYLAVARRNAQAAAAGGHSASVPPLIRRTRQPIGQAASH